MASERDSLREAADRLADEWGRESFPASDPPVGWSGKDPKGSGASNGSAGAGTDAG